MKLLLRNLNTSRDVRRLDWLRTILTVGIAFVCWASAAQAVDPNRSLSQYIRDHWGSEKGFTGGSVTAIAQTADGYLWIGTEKGLIRFDGLSFREYPQAIPTTFPIGAVQQLVADAQGNLWILLQSTKILRYHDEKFELGREQVEFGITSVLKRRDGTVLFSSLAYGILAYRGGKFEIVSRPEERAGSEPSGTADDLSTRLSWATGVTPHRFADPDSAVIAMAEDTDGKLWLGTQDKGLFYMSGGKVFNAGNAKSITKINCLLVLSNREIWIGTDQGLVRWDGTEITSQRVPPSLVHRQILSMIRDRDSNIWVGTPSGLIRVNAAGASLDSSDSRTNGPVTTLFEDREGDLWAGGPRGIDRLRDSAFISYSVGGLQSESAGPIYVDEKERVWFAPFEGGLQWLAGGKGRSVTTAGLSRDVVYSITGREGELWIGRQRGGLTHLSFANGSVSGKTYTRTDGLAQNGVYAVYEGHDGTIWAGTLSGGVSKYKNGHFTTFTTADGMSSNTVTAITEAADGTMWFATPNGISALKEGHWSVFGKSKGLPSENVNCLFVDSSGVLWVGTASGLAFLQSGHMESAQAVAALQEQILGIAEDKHEWLWISTANHVLRVNRDKILNSMVSDPDVREYGIQDGLNGTEGVKRYQSVYIDPLGKIWFSMNRGISVADPTRAISSSAPSLVHIEGVTADGNAVGLQGPVRLTGPQRRIVFTYLAPSLAVPERVRYKYKLEGLDESWSNPVSAREVTYNNLNSGKYRFRLIASNGDGMWESAESDVTFSITPPYWQTIWFRLGVALVTALGILLIYRLRMRQLAAQLNMRFEERLAERTRIAQELHDTLLQGFLSASMQLHVVADKLPDDSAAKPALDRVLLLMGRVTEEGRNAVGGLRSTEGSSGDLALAFSQIQQEFPGQEQVSFHVIVEGSPRTLRPVARDEIYRIGRESLTNAFRHSKAASVEVELEYAAKQLRVLVRDSGAGFDPQILQFGRQGHWGLSGMRERAKGIGASLRVWSRPGAGTEVELTVPGNIAYVPEPPGRVAKWISRWLPRGKGRFDQKSTREPER